MAKVTTTSLIAGLSGKVCQHDNTYFVTNRQTGQVHTAKICHPRNDEPSEAQVAVRERFVRRSQNTSAWIRDNGPSTSTPRAPRSTRKP